MDRHVDAVHRFLISLNADPTDSQDALQECFVSAWRSAATYRGSASARSWLMTIARNALRRHHRRRAGEPASLESLDVLGEDAGWGMVEDFAARFESSEAMDRALRRVPEEQREVVVLRDLLGMSGAETADVLEIGVAAMKSRLHRGRLQLMAALRQLEQDHG